MARAPRKITARAAPLLVLALLLLGAGRAEAITLPADFQDSFVANANQPTSLAFVPGGRLLIAEEAGVVRVYKNGALNAAPALDIRARVCSDGERGLMAVAVDPQFESNHFIYVYYTWVKNGCVYDDANTPVNRVARFVLRDDDTVDPSAETVLIDNIPAPQSYHIGADLQFGKDGLLYVSTGDGGCDYAGDSGCLELNDAARDRHVLLAKILRVTRDGAIPAGNPWQGAGTARCNVTGRTSSGHTLPGDLRVGTAQPVPAGRRPQLPDDPFLHQRRGRDHLGGDRPGPDRRGLRLERARGVLRHGLHDGLWRAAGRDDEPSARLQPRAQRLLRDHRRRIRAQGHLVHLLRRRLPLRRPGVRQDLPDVAPDRRRL